MKTSTCLERLTRHHDDADVAEMLDRQLYATHDANFNVTSLETGSGTVAERFVYNAYGKFTVTTSSWSTTTDSKNWLYNFQGLRWDSAAGLYFARNRTYSPTLMRWSTAEPSGANPYVDGMNLYQAFAANPINSRDPSGMYAEPNWSLIMVPPDSSQPLTKLQECMEESWNRSVDNKNTGDLKGHDYWISRFDKYEKAIMKKPTVFLSAFADFQDDYGFANEICGHAFIYRTDNGHDATKGAKSQYAVLRSRATYRTRDIVSGTTKRATQANDDEIENAITSFNRSGTYSWYYNNCIKEVSDALTVAGLTTEGQNGG